MRRGTGPGPDCVQPPCLQLSVGSDCHPTGHNTAVNVNLPSLFLNHCGEEEPATTRGEEREASAPAGALRR